MPWILNENNEILNEETGVIFSPDHPVYLTVYEEDGKTYVYITNEEIPEGVDPREFTSVTTSSSMDVFEGDPMRENVWKDKYIRKRVQTPASLFALMTKEIHRIESKYPNPLSEARIMDLLLDFKKVIGGGSVMYGIGNEDPVSLSNCYVIANPLDSYGGILHTEQEMIQLMKRRGGVGFDLGNLRPAKATVRNAAKTSTGLASFAERYSNGTREVAQDGRRGALMLTLDIDNPEAEAFVDAKMDKSKINGANISVKVGDGLMTLFSDSVLEPLGKKSFIKGENPMPSPIGKGVKKASLSTMELLFKIVENQVKSAEPGILFWDRIRRESPADRYADEGFATTSTNPCGEVPLAPYDSCRLLHLNLTSYVDLPFTPDAEFDFDRFAKDVQDAQRILDDIVDLEIEAIDRILKKIASDPEPDEIKRTEINLWEKVSKMAIKGRRTGLGHTGIADVFAMMGLPYGSTDAITLAENIQREIAYNSYRSSIIMAKERGAFPVFNHMKENNHPFIERILEMIDDEEDIINMYHRYGRRNISTMTIAPTGTTSILAGVSSGVEPVFDIRHKRRVKKQQGKNEEWQEYIVIHPMFKKWYEATRPESERQPLDKISDDELRNLILESPYSGSLTNDIDPAAKILMIGKLQQYVDHSISVTHNLPRGTTPKTVQKMLATAYEVGCKGFTVYVDGSREGVLSHVDGNQRTFSFNDAVKRPGILPAELHITTVDKKPFVVAIGILDGHPYEVFAFDPSALTSPRMTTESIIKIISDEGNMFQIQKVRSGRYDLKVLTKDDKLIYNISNFNKATDADAEVICRLISTSLRHGVEITYLFEQINNAGASLNTFAKAVSRTFKRYLNSDNMNRKAEECPVCHKGKLIFREGCMTCESCGHSKC